MAVGRRGRPATDDAPVAALLAVDTRPPSGHPESGPKECARPSGTSVIRAADRTTWRSAATAALLVVENEGAYSVHDGAVLVVTEGAREVAYFTSAWS